MSNLNKEITAGISKLSRGLVWCKFCGKEQKVDSAHCLGHGWPKCCGETMTIDSPEERKKLTTPKD